MCSGDDAAVIVSAQSLERRRASPHTLKLLQTHAHTGTVHVHKLPQLGHKLPKQISLCNPAAQCSWVYKDTLTKL